MKRNKTFKAVAAVVAMAALGAGCSQNKTEANEWGCQYGGGLIESKGLKNTIAPGDKGGWSVFDTKVTIPAGVRTYVLDEDPTIADLGAKPLTLPAKGRTIEVNGEKIPSEGIVTVAIELQARFTFNEKVCEWYSNIGKNNEPLNFDAGQGEESGWAEFLNLSWNQKMTEAARPVVSDYDWLEMYTNDRTDEGEERVFALLNNEISTNLTRELANDLGDNYFCGPTYVFDGNADGEIGTCPPIEITVKEIKPTNPELVTNYEAIVANAEAQQKIASDRDRSIAQTAADQEVELANEAKRREVETAKAANDEAIAVAQKAALEAERINADIQAVASAAYCVALAESGIDCALLEAAEQGTYPRIVLSDGTSVDLLVNGE